MASNRALDHFLKLRGRMPWLMAGTGTKVLCSMCVMSRDTKDGEPCYLAVDLVKGTDRQVGRFLRHHRRCGFLMNTLEMPQ